jgi:TRAP transporter TAXI family solute receptor
MMTKLLLLAGALVMAAGAASAQSIGIATTPPGSFTHSTASAMAKVIVEKTGIQARIQPSASHQMPSVEAGEMEFSLTVDYDLIFFVRGTEDYQGSGKKKNIRMVANVLPLLVGPMVKVDSPVKSVADLKGKRIGTDFGAQKSVFRVWLGYLANAGLSLNDIVGVPAQNVVRAADDFLTGKTDAFIFALGSAKVKEVYAGAGGVRTLPADPSPDAMARTQKIMPGSYTAIVKPSPRLQEVKQDMPMIGFDLVLFASASVPDNTVYKVTKALHESKKDLAASFGPLAAFAPAKMAKTYPDLQYHPGAVKFYKEAGLWQPK